MKTKDEMLMKEVEKIHQQTTALEASKNGHRLGEEKLQKLLSDLGKRIKELNCLYGISHLFEKPNISLEEILQGTVDIIPPAWQYPEITAARIILEDQSFETTNFKETRWKQTSDIIVRGNRIGTVEVYYLAEKPESDEGPFFKEEKALIDAIAERLGRIIERKLAEKALRISEAQLNAILDASIDRIRLVDTDMRILWANKTTAKELNITPEGFIGKCCYQVFVGKDTPCPECPTKKALTSGNIEHAIVYQPYSKGIEGKTYWDVYAKPIKDESGDIVNFIQIARNITDKVKDEEEKKMLESQLQHAKKMEAIGTLAGGIAHDFNNLLMGIQGYDSLMLMDIDPTHPHYEMLKGIEQLIRSGANLTRQLLGFARGGKYEEKPTDLNEIIRKSSAMFARTKKEITIRRKYQKGIWTVEADQGQIEQILLNLYINAWHAMLGGGELYLETQNVTLDEDYIKPFDIKLGRYVKISVTDTGVGMDEATQQRIFEPFFTTKELGRGTGVGLASVYGIIKNHGGYINVYSKKAEGTTFTIYLPASGKEVVEEEKVPDKIQSGIETILLVDDEDMVADVGSQMLKKLGYKVLIARSGKEAIEVVSKAQRAKRREEKGKKGHASGAMPPAPDIVILDMIMPVMGGDETYDRMKEINPDIKILLSSGYSIDGQAAEILKRGCDGFIQKPFALRELSQRIREILDKE